MPGPAGDSTSGTQGLSAHPPPHFLSTRPTNPALQQQHHSSLGFVGGYQKGGSEGTQRLGVLEEVEAVGNRDRERLEEIKSKFAKWKHQETEAEKDPRA